MDHDPSSFCGSCGTLLDEDALADGNDVLYCKSCYELAGSFEDESDPSDSLDTCDSCGDRVAGDTMFEGRDGALYYCPSCADDMGLE